MSRHSCVVGYPFELDCVNSVSLILFGGMWCIMTPISTANLPTKVVILTVVSYSDISGPRFDCTNVAILVYACNQLNHRSRAFYPWIFEYYNVNKHSLVDWPYLAVTYTTIKRCIASISHDWESNHAWPCQQGRLFSKIDHVISNRIEMVFI